MRWVSEGRQEPSVTWACLEAAARTGDHCKLPQLCIQKDTVAAVQRTDAEEWQSYGAGSHCHDSDGAAGGSKAENRVSDADELEPSAQKVSSGEGQGTRDQSQERPLSLAVR